MPFLTEEIYRNLTDEDSVHLSDWPSSSEELINPDLEKRMDLARALVQEGHAVRKSNGWGVKDPQKDITWTSPDDYGLIRDDVDIQTIVLKELNTYKVEVSGKLSYKDKEYDNITDAYLLQQGEARRIIRSIQEERKKLGTTMGEKINVEIPTWPQDFEVYIKKSTLIENLNVGTSLKVTKIA